MRDARGNNTARSREFHRRAIGNRYQVGIEHPCMQANGGRASRPYRAEVGTQKHVRRRHCYLDFVFGGRGRVSVHISERNPDIVFAIVEPFRRQVFDLRCSLVELRFYGFTVDQDGDRGRIYRNIAVGVDPRAKKRARVIGNGSRRFHIPYLWHSPGKILRDAQEIRLGLYSLHRREAESESIVGM